MAPVTTAVIVAAGRGERAGRGEPKQFRRLAGRPLVAHTVDRLLVVPEVGRVVLVLPAAADLDNRLAPPSRWSGRVQAVKGGADRSASVRAGLEAAGDVPLVVIHDGVRPLVPAWLVSRVIQAAAEVGAALAAAPCTDTIKEVQAGRVRTTRDRDGLFLAQTPQAFRTDLLRRAHAAAGGEGAWGTDDATLVEQLGEPVAVVQGPVTNLKVTRPDDLAVAEVLLAAGWPRADGG